MSEKVKKSTTQEPSFREKILDQLKETSSGTASLESGATMPFQLNKQSSKKSKQEENLEETRVLPVRKERPRQSRAELKKHRKKQEKAAGRIALTVIIVVLLALGVAGYSGYAYIKSSLGAYDAQSSEVVQVEIPMGSSTREIATILEKNKLIKNATVFTYYAKFKSYNNFQSGFYNLSQTMSVDELAKALQEIGTETATEPIAGKVRVIEGYTLEQIADAISDNVHTKTTKDKTPFTREEFLETATNADFIASMVAKYPTLLASLPAADSGVRYQLEGYLYPATYSYTKEQTVGDIIDKMLAAMDSQLQAYYGQLEGKGLTVNALLTLASLVEKEGSTDEDRRTIASVFYNRLNTDMPLQSNIAILYAMGKLGQATTLAEDAAIDTAIDSPYNIYVHTGLMPGPVDSPSIDAIAATFSPNHTDYLYFVADVTTGTVYYAKTYEEHEKNVQQYVNSQLTN